MSESDIETLRRAAAKMRKLADEASHPRWHAAEPPGWGGGEADWDVMRAGAWNVMHDDPRWPGSQFNVAGPVFWGDAEYIAAMDPDVGLALADWLDGYADEWSESPSAVLPEDRLALAVARTFLRE